MISTMSNECLRVFVSNLSVKDLDNSNFDKIASNFKQSFDQKAKEKQLLNSTVILKQN